MGRMHLHYIGPYLLDHSTDIRRGKAILNQGIELLAINARPDQIRC